MARMAELQPVAFRSFSRNLITVSLSCSLEGSADGSHFSACSYHETVDGETLCRYWRSLINCGKPICGPLQGVLPFRSRTACLRRDGRVAEGARLESVFTRKGNVGSNPTLSAMLFQINMLREIPNPLSGTHFVFGMLGSGAIR
jgi:hypothetical protein